jgi:glycosyltransferase involved in cell wall biosynthesis
MKVAIFHDYFDKLGGGEQVALTLAKEFKADIYTGFVSETFPEIKKLNVYEVGKKIKNALLRTFYLQHKFSRLKLKKKYDAFIFSGTICIAAAHKCHPNIWYCHTPARHIYSQREWFLSQLNWGTKLFVRGPLLILEALDKLHIKKIDKFVSNSENVKNRISKYYGEKYANKTTVIYPPIKLKKYSPKKGNYYLSFARLDDLKRVSLIVEAFKKMPDKKLIVASGGPLLEKLKSMASKNTTILGYVSDEKLKSLIESCIATIYIPVDEDFGMSPLEGMAAGKPCIGVDEGGLKETIVHGKNGFLCQAEIKTSDIVKGVEWMTVKKAEEMKKDCIESVKAFSEEMFLNKMRKLL